jgi:hypothetical protein
MWSENSFISQVLAPHDPLLPLVTGLLGLGHTARRTIQGYEAIHRLRKGQIEGIAKRDVLAQNRVINQLFGLAA